MPEIAVALDLPSGRDALALADRLPGLRWVKVGPVLFVREGPSLVQACLDLVPDHPRCLAVAGSGA